MLLLWSEGLLYWIVGLASTSASHLPTGSAPATRVGVAYGTADLQRDQGRALFQSIFEALSAGGYTAALEAELAAVPDSSKILDSATSGLEKSYPCASNVVAQYPQYAKLYHVSV